MKNFVAFMMMFFSVLSTSAMAADISYSGSSTIGTSILKVGAVAAFKTKTGISFSKLDEPGSGKGVKALLDGQVSLAGASRPLKPEEKKEKLIGTTIGYDAIAVFVHVDNPITNLS
jgi:phosphate transport system substrate-binding protein